MGRNGRKQTGDKAGEGTTAVQDTEPKAQTESADDDKAGARSKTEQPKPAIAGRFRALKSFSIGARNCTPGEVLEFNIDEVKALGLKSGLIEPA